MEAATSSVHRLITPKSVVLPRRRLFSTTLGMVGLGPMSIMEGDHVCIFKGARVPLIVRQRPLRTSLEFIGEAYLGGHIYGELEENNYPVQHIVLA